MNAALSSRTAVNSRASARQRDAARARSAVYVGWVRRGTANLETYSTGMKQRIKLGSARARSRSVCSWTSDNAWIRKGGRDAALVRDIAANKGIALILSSHRFRCRVHL